MRVQSASVTRISSDGARLARVVALAAVLGQIANYLFALYVHQSDDLFLVGVAALLLLLFGSIIAMAVVRREATAGVLATGERRSVVIGEAADDDALCVRPSEVRGGFAETITGVHQVTLQRARDAIVIRAASAEQASAILEAANVSAAQRVLTLQVSRQGSAGARGAIGCLFVGSAVWAIASLVYVALALVEWDVTALGFVFAATPWLIFVLSARALLDRPITIGRDGVRFGAFRAWFLPYRGLEVRVQDAYVVFERDRRTHFVKTTGSAEARAIVARVDAARRESNEAMARDVVARAGRSLPEWRAHLLGLIGVGGDYRAAALGPSELVELTDDALAPPDVRIGAAVALSVLPDDHPERARVRVAIETAANPRLRSALERALCGEIELDAELARA